MWFLPCNFICFGSNALNYALLECFQCFQTEGQGCITATLQRTMWKYEICTNADWNQKLYFLCKYNLWLTLHLTEHCVKSCWLKFVIWSRRVKYKHYLYKKKNIHCSFIDSCLLSKYTFRLKYLFYKNSCIFMIIQTFPGNSVVCILIEKKKFVAEQR